ncbi:MAG: MFS transporter [Tetrasphaera sp.]
MRPTPAASGLGVALLCMAINMVDGFDLLIVGFVLPNLDRDFASTPQKGWVVSLGLVGMAVGAIGLARFADRYGRRLIALAGAATTAVGLLLSAWSPTVEFMMGARFITGMGIGMISVVIVVAAQETAEPRLRNLATGLVMIGYPLGSLLAALSTNAITSTFGANWKALYLLGAGLTVLAFVAMFVGLPESVQKAEAAFESEAHISHEAAEANRSILSKALLAITVLLCVGYMTVAGVFNFAAGLTPEFVKTAMLAGSDSSTDPATLATATAAARSAGQNIGLWLSAGCLVGAISLAVVGLVMSAVRLTWIYCAIAVASMVGFANSFPHAGESPSTALAVFAVLLGIGIFGAISSYSALVPISYPPYARAKGYGAMLGFGRAGAVAAPLVSAYLVSEIGPQRLYNYINLLLVISLACAAGVVLMARRRGPAALTLSS